MWSCSYSRRTFLCPCTTCTPHDELLCAQSARHPSPIIFPASLNMLWVVLWCCKISRRNSRVVSCPEMGPSIGLCQYSPKRAIKDTSPSIFEYVTVCFTDVHQCHALSESLCRIMARWCESACHHGTRRHPKVGRATFVYLFQTSSLLICGMDVLKLSYCRDVCW